jgi:hypothetical protein
MPTALGAIILPTNAQTTLREFATDRGLPIVLKVEVPSSPRGTNLLAVAQSVECGGTETARAPHECWDRQPWSAGSPVESHPHEVIPMREPHEGSSLFLIARLSEHFVDLTVVTGTPSG